MKIADILALTQGQLYSAPSISEISCIHTDLARVNRGDLFIATPYGATREGIASAQNLADAAIKRGAFAIIASAHLNISDIDIAYIYVGDILYALRRLASYQLLQDRQLLYIDGGDGILPASLSMVEGACVGYASSFMVSSLDANYDKASYHLDPSAASREGLALSALIEALASGARLILSQECALAPLFSHIEVKAPPYSLIDSELLVSHVRYDGALYTLGIPSCYLPSLFYLIGLLLRYSVPYSLYNLRAFDRAIYVNASLAIVARESASRLLIIATSLDDLGLLKRHFAKRGAHLKRQLFIARGLIEGAKMEAKRNEIERKAEGKGVESKNIERKAKTSEALLDEAEAFDTLDELVGLLRGQHYSVALILGIGIARLREALTPSPSPSLFDGL